MEMHQDVSTNKRSEVHHKSPKSLQMSEADTSELQLQVAEKERLQAVDFFLWVSAISSDVPQQDLLQRLSSDNAGEDVA